MANMCMVSYAIEGNRRTLKRISEKINGAMKGTIPEKEGSSNNWQGNVLTALNIQMRPRDDIRGFFYEEPKLEGGVLKFNCEEKWHRGEFAELLERKFPSLSVYWIAEESGCGIYETNDADGKYFAERYWVDTCVDGGYDSEYFETEEAVWEYLTNRAGCKNAEDVEAFNDAVTNGEDFIYIHEFEIV